MELSNPNAYDKKTTQCFLCESGQVEFYHRDYRDNVIVRCGDCDIQFMNPQYSDQYLEEYYSGYTGSDEAEVWDEALHYGHGFYLSCIEKAMKQNLDHFKPGSLFDFGCGNGMFMDVAKKRGWDVTGYDVDPVSTSRAADRIGCKVYSGDFFLANIEKKFDLILMHQVLEHLKDPVKYMSKLTSMLNPGGFMFIAVPNIHSASNRLKFFMEKSGLRKKRVGAYFDTSHHLFYYHYNSLKNFLKKFNLQVVYKRNCHKVYPGQSSLERFITRNIKDRVMSNSAFFVVVQKK